jgi:Holliday junction resolvase
MGRSQREKGKRGEQEIARLFRAEGYDVDRVPNSGGLHIPGDITGLDGFHIEVKRQEVIRILEWCRQSETEAPDETIPLVIWRRSREPWRVTLPLAFFFKMIKEEHSEVTNRAREADDASVRTLPGVA